MTGKKGANVGLIGLGVMGRNLALNIADHGFSVVGLDRNEKKVEELNEAGLGNARGVSSVDEMISGLEKPRAVLLLVPAGDPVDSAIAELRDRIDEADLIVDCGNSHFTDTDRRAGELAARKIEFLGVGVSGGEKGARNGPSMMPGGPEEAYERVRPIFEAAAAKAHDEPCVTYLGPGSAGHYVKMVHNGIEYALMQLIAETYDLLRGPGQMSNDNMADVFGDWNRGPLASYLIEITSRILRVPDSGTDERLVDMVLDAARQKGTGMWACQDAMELQVPVPTIDAAVSMRDLSGRREERREAAEQFPSPGAGTGVDPAELAGDLEGALRFGMIASYAQGMSLLRTASETYGYGLDLGEIARIWRAGCIIRAGMLDEVRKAFRDEPEAAGLMTSRPFADVLKESRTALCRVLRIAADSGITAPAMASVLAYFDGYRTERLPANLIQAQRDCFGAHTYERIDRDGSFHTEWT
jgi:6-phosphogluconate dehydrogenase